MTTEQAANRARDVQRNAQGTVEFASASSTAVSTGNTGTTVTTKVTVTEKVQYSRVSATIGSGSADITISRNGSKIVSSTGVTSAEAVVGNGTVRASSVTWTLNAKFNSLPTGTKTVKFGNQGGDVYATGTSSTDVDYGFGTIHDTYEKVKVYATPTAGAGTLKMLVESNYVFSQNVRGSTGVRFTGTATGSYTPTYNNVTWYVHATDVYSIKFGDAQRGFYMYNTDAYVSTAANLNVSKESLSSPEENYRI